MHYWTVCITAGRHYGTIRPQALYAGLTLFFCFLVGSFNLDTLYLYLTKISDSIFFLSVWVQSWGEVTGKAFVSVAKADRLEVTTTRGGYVGDLSCLLLGCSCQEVHRETFLGKVHTEKRTRKKFEDA